MNAVLIAVIVMLVLALLRVHVVVALFLGAIVGGLMSGMGLDATMVAFQDGLGGGAKIALSYALLGAFAMGVASAGLPQVLANFLIRKLGGSGEADPKTALATKWMLILGLIALSVSAAKDDNARKALEQIKELAGCDVHTTTILGSVDEGIFRNLGVLVTSDPVFARKKALYQKR